MHGRPLSAPEPAFVGRVFERLIRNRLPLILRHNFTGLPEGIGLEVKFLIRRDDEAAAGVLPDTSRVAGGELLHVRERAALWCRWCCARSLWRRPLAAALRLGRHWGGELGHGCCPPGIHLALMGPDGSGKSTVIEAVKARISHHFGETVEHHWRPSLLPDIGVLLGRRETNTGPVTDPHGRRPHSRAASLARLLYYWLDYWLGWPLRVWKPKAQNQLVIFDRYAPDMWCDPRRYRLRLPKQLAKVICRCVPQPDLTFVLVAPAETIHQRKGEVPLETLRELLRNYQELAQQGGNVRAVDCSRPVADIADEIAASVRAQLKARTKRYSWFK